MYVPDGRRKRAGDGYVICGSAVLGTARASAYVACNSDGDCWHTDARVAAPAVTFSHHPDAGISISIGMGVTDIFGIIMMVAVTIAAGSGSAFKRSRRSKPLLQSVFLHGERPDASISGLSLYYSNKKRPELDRTSRGLEWLKLSRPESRPPPRGKLHMQPCAKTEQLMAKATTRVKGRRAR
jgi:hypothetical protein